MTALRLTAVLLCLLYVSEAFSLSSTRCCTRLGENISKGLLKKVKGYEIQKQDGTCHLQAVLLHLKHKTLCISPKNKRVQQWIIRQRMKSSGNQELRTKERTKRRNNPKKKKKKTRERKTYLT
ncbi:C-C motif chemokine 28 [Leptodactylus fuscus]